VSTVSGLILAPGVIVLVLRPELKIRMGLH